MREALVLNKSDNVATAIKDLKGGQEVGVNVKEQEEIKKIILQQNISFGHKFASVKIRRGENVIKYGKVIGRAMEDIDIGEWVHIHNVESTRGRGDLKN